MIRSDCPGCGEGRNGYENHHCPPGATVKPRPSPEARDTLEVLYKIKREMGKERARYIRFYETATDQHNKDRSYYEANVCSMMMSIVDKQVRKLKESK